MRFFRLIFGLALLAAGLPAFAESDSADALHVHVQLVSEYTMLSERPSEARLGLYFKLEPGWHIYWKNAGDSGEPPKVDWTLPEGMSAGSLQFPAPKRLPLGPLMDFGYENEVLFPVDLKIKKVPPRKSVSIAAKVSWLVCRESCIPGKADLSIDLSTEVLEPGEYPGAADIFKRFANTIPRLLPENIRAAFQSTDNGLRLMVATGRHETQAEFYPEDKDVLNNPAPQKQVASTSGLILDLKKDANLKTNPAQLRGVLELADGRVYDLAALPGSVPLVESSPVVESSLGLLLRSFGLAFIGGLLLNLMPCVFPVLFLKGLALVNSGKEERSKLRAHGLVYAAGILASLWVLVAVLLGLRATGATFGWGFQFQSPIFLLCMAGLLFFLGLSLAGQFEIGLTLTSTGGSLAAKKGYAGSFFTGVLAVVVATPCTAPFMGAAIGYALSQSALVTFAVFTALALGLAAPYVLLTLQPVWMQLLPKPGMWMEVLRQATAVPVFATVIWLAWVLMQAYGTDALVTLLTSLLLLAIAGWFLGRWPAKRWSVVVTVLILAGVVGLAVREQYAANRADAPSIQNAATANGWEPWSAGAVNSYRAQGRVVFVDFTASWCLSCQVNEGAALDTPQVQQAFKSANIVLLKADWTRHDEAITQALQELGRSGVPVYAIFVPGEERPRLLPEALTPGIVISAIQEIPHAATQTASEVSHP